MNSELLQMLLFMLYDTLTDKEKRPRIFRMKYYGPKLAYATAGSACFDIAISEDAILHTSKIQLIPTALFFEFDANEFLKIYIRSSLAKRGILLANSVGIIDNDYRHELKLLLLNTTDAIVVLKAGDRVAQGELCQLHQPKMHQLSARPSETESRLGGFGSTGA